METPQRPGGGRPHSSQSNDQYASVSAASARTRPRMAPTPPSQKQTFVRQPSQHQQSQRPQESQAVIQRDGQSASTSAQAPSSRGAEQNETPARKNEDSNAKQANQQLQRQPQDAQKQSESRPQGREAPISPFKQVISSSLSSFTPSQTQSPVKRAAPFAVAPVNPTAALTARKNVLAKRLRINLICLLAWYLITDSRLYLYSARHLIRTLPETRRVIVWLVHRILPALLAYNAIEAFARIKWAPISEKPATTVAVSAAAAAPAVTSAAAGTPIRTTNLIRSIHKSSPLTRPSTNMLPSPSLARIAPASTQQDTSQSQQPDNAATPPRLFRPDSIINESPTAALRRALLADATTNRTSPARQSMSPGKISGGADALTSSAIPPFAHQDSPNPRVQAYFARHNTTACKRRDDKTFPQLILSWVAPFSQSLSTRSDIDRLLASRS